MPAMAQNDGGSRAPNPALKTYQSNAKWAKPMPKAARQFHPGAELAWL